MDEGNSMLEDTSYNENDEIDGSILSRIKKKRGVKVSGKYVPPLGWENIVASHPASSTNHYFEKLNDMKNFMDSSFQVHDNIKAKHPKQDQTSVNSDHTESDTTTIEHGKQITEMPSTTELGGTKMMEDVSKEKKKSRKQKIQITEKASEKSIPLGIPRETLEELKNLLKDSPIINKKKNSNFKHSAISHMQIPKSAEKVIENSNLTFETFRPRLVRDTKESQSINEPEEKHSDKSVIDQILTLPIQSQTDEQLVKEFDEKQSFVHDKANTSTGIKFDLVSTELTDSTCASIKDLEPGNSGIQNTLHLISHVEHIKQQIAKDDIHFVRFEAADLHGVSRSKTIPARFFHDKAFSGIYMPRNYLELTVNPKDNEVDHINSSSFNSDIVLKPDLQTFRVLPWAEKTGRVICDSYTITNNPLLTSPRHLAKQLLNQLQEVGLSIHAAFTYEFCIFGVAEILNSKTIAFPAATLLTDNDHLFMQEVFDGMYYIGGSIESFSSSSGPGQMEISFQHEYGLNAADNAFTFRTCIKEVAKKHGCIASFYTDAGGYYNTGVLSHSLWDTDGNKNVFYSASHTEELTNIGKKWLSGLVFHSAALSCLVAPGVSCRKRFSKNIKESQESICVTCGFNDNSCAYNIKCHGCKGTYIENKLCSATANPYLVLAATIAAGLDGIRRDLDYFEGTNSGAGLQQLKSSSIPLKLEDALTSLEEDKYMRSALGEAFIHYFIAMKKYELETEELDSERNKFLEYFI